MIWASFFNDICFETLVIPIWEPCGLKLKFQCLTMQWDLGQRTNPESLNRNPPAVNTAKARQPQRYLQRSWKLRSGRSSRNLRSSLAGF